MGNYKIEIEAVGGHGCDRKAQPGEALHLPHDENCPDCIAKRFVEQLGKSGSSVMYATLTHWPENPDLVVDDLKNGKRLARSFTMAAEQEHILQFFAFSHLPEKLQAISQPFCHAAHLIIATTPRNPERTVALRKLLEAKDAAVRAALAK